MMKHKPTTPLGKFWYFIWYEDSIWSWIANIILAFIIIKFIVYPVLGALFGTSFPVVAVVSNSMEHDSSFDNWWNSQSDFYQDFNISKDDFKSYSFKNGFNKGDIMILLGTEPEKITIGDVIVFEARNKTYPIIHRVVKIKIVDENLVFETKGDHNIYQINAPELDETNVTLNSYIGRAVLRIPFIGYVKIWFVDILKAIGLAKLV
ncbi:MAG: signal peptidase I [Nanoarchaeota archaeon]|nr:signal peptidase I [Nanoarchaeota archaeon]MBU1269518.1 signal peptidase I [Nanoarchaeota archaeon]MBU2443674.1 signal peptidase I [Nanoarchaeota archaeon]